MFINSEDPNKQHEHYMRMALQQAKEAKEADEVPIGAVIVYKNKVIAKSHNLTERLTDFTAHAEMQAFTMASAALGNKYLTQCTLYVTIEPCLMCAGAAFWTRIGTLVYGAPDPRRGYARVKETVIHPKTKVVTGIFEDECRDILIDFFAQKRQ